MSPAQQAIVDAAMRLTEKERSEVVDALGGGVSSDLSEFNAAELSEIEAVVDELDRDASAGLDLAQYKSWIAKERAEPIELPSISPVVKAILDATETLPLSEQMLLADLLTARLHVDCIDPLEREWGELSDKRDDEMRQHPELCLPLEQVIAELRREIRR
jgi:hypothetical protein